MERVKELWTLLLDFAHFGIFTFGGGWSIIAQMQQKYVEKQKTITAQELMDLTSVAKSLPGTMISNVAMLYGYRAGGLAGGFAAVFGMVLPPMAVLICISLFYNAFRTNYWVAAVMEGMQAAVAPIICSAAIGLAKGSFQKPLCFAVVALCLGLYLFTDVSAVALVAIGIVSGFAMAEYYERKEGKAHGAA